jgi:hypothetical protein
MKPNKDELQFDPKDVSLESEQRHHDIGLSIKQHCLCAGRLCRFGFYVQTGKAKVTVMWEQDIALAKNAGPSGALLKLNLR